MIMHDVNLAIRYCDHVLLLFDNGEHLAGHSKEVITVDRLSSLYDYPMRSLPDKDGGIYIPA
jgi:ABC-type cobalamin/Fe3+-siderophores transport system ATPase subunit